MDQLRFGPPPVVGVNVQIMRGRDGWIVVGRVCREGAGWSPLEQSLYGPMSFVEAQEVAAELVWGPPGV